MRGLYSLVLGLFLAVSTGTSWAQCRLPQLRSYHQPPRPNSINGQNHFPESCCCKPCEGACR